MANPSLAMDVDYSVNDAQTDGVVSMWHDALIPELDYLFSGQPTPAPPSFMTTSTFTLPDDKGLISMFSPMAELNAPNMWMPPILETPSGSQMISGSELCQWASNMDNGWGSQNQQPLDEGLLVSNPPLPNSTCWQGSIRKPSETSHSSSSKGVASMTSLAQSSGMDSYWIASNTVSLASSCAELKANESPINARLEQPDIFMGWSEEMAWDGRERVVEETCTAPTFKGTGMITTPSCPSTNSYHDPNLAATLEPYALDPLKLRSLTTTAAHKSTPTTSTSNLANALGSGTTKRMPPPRASHGVPAPTSIHSREKASTLSGIRGWTTSNQHPSAHNVQDQRSKRSGAVKGWTGEQPSHPPTRRPTAVQPQSSAQVYGWSAPCSPGTSSDVWAFDTIPTALSVGRKIPAPAKFPSRRSATAAVSVTRTSTKDLRRKVLKQSAAPYRGRRNAEINQATKRKEMRRPIIK